MGLFSPKGGDECEHGLDSAACRGDLTEEQVQRRAQFWSDRREILAEVRDACLDPVKLRESAGHLVDLACALERPQGGGR